ncbi:MAG: hypothetical protein Q9159_001109 [Coniocarpon cinnabarinum]
MPAQPSSLTPQVTDDRHSKYDTPSHLLLPFHRPLQTAYLALRTFNLETARIADATSNPTVGTMRMQFWRDALSGALSLTPPKEPVAVLLAAAQGELLTITEGKSKLSKNWVLRIVNEREKHLHNPPMPDLKALEGYAENTYSSLLYLTLQALPMASVTADHVASHIGKAQGIVAVLRGLPLVAFPAPQTHTPQGQFAGPAGGGQRQGAVTLPLDVMAKHNVREHEVLKKGIEAAGLRDAIFEVATRANDHLITAREMVKNLRAGRDAGHEYEHSEDEEHQGREGERESGVVGQLADVERAFGAFMPAVCAQEWLDRLQKVDFDVFQPSLRTSGWKLPARVYWAFTRKTF